MRARGDIDKVAASSSIAAGSLPAVVSAAARVDSRTKRLVKRLSPGDVAVIDHADLDALAAESLADARVSAVINAQPFVTGRYPNRGPAVLSAAGIPLYQLPDSALFAEFRDKERIKINERGELIRRGKPSIGMLVWDDFKIDAMTMAARANLGQELERFARNTLQYLDAEKDLLLDPTDVPMLQGQTLNGRHALVVVRGEGYKKDLRSLRSYIKDVRPVLIAVDGAADAMIEYGYRPDVIIGDMDSVSDGALKCGAQLIVHAYARRSGEAPGLARVESLGLKADQFAVPGTSEDAALLLAFEHNADLIVAVGTHSNLVDFLDKGRNGMASTFLVRLKVGPKLVDARGASRLYRRQPGIGEILAVLLSALFPLVVLLSYSQILINIVESVRVWLRLHVH